MEDLEHSNICDAANPTCWLRLVGAESYLRSAYQNDVAEAFARGDNDAWESYCQAIADSAAAERTYTDLDSALDAYGFDPTPENRSAAIDAVQSHIDVLRSLAEIFDDDDDDDDEG